MPSTLKTQNLGLNKFISTDKPKMDDFNFDNQTIDTKFGTHLNDTQKHLTTADRTILLNSKIIIGTYTGNGANVQTINLGWKPTAGIVFTPSFIPYRNDPNFASLTEVTSAFFTSLGSSIGVDIVSNGFNVKMNCENDVNTEFVALNLVNTSYIYMVWR